MMTLRFWDRTTPARWFSRSALGLLALLALAAGGRAGELQTLVRAYRNKPGPASREAVARYAAAHAKQREGALAYLALGIGEYEQRQFQEASGHLGRAGQDLASLSDYLAYYTAAARIELHDLEGTVQALSPVWSPTRRSPLAGDAAMLEARANKDRGMPGDSVKTLRLYYSQLPQPEGDLLLASCYRAANDLTSAVVYYQRVYYQYPASGEGEQAGTALSELKAALGGLFPPPTTQAMFQRAAAWLRAGMYGRARTEFQAIAAQAGGSDRDIARVRIGSADYYAYETTSAYRYFQSLDRLAPEADAERLYYLTECARRLDRDDRMMEAIGQLAERYPNSPWRVKALVTVANRYLVRNRADLYEPLYRACYAAVPDDPQADYCHWKIAWYHYIHRQADAVALLREHLVTFPGSERASSALYFLGRAAEAGNQPEQAKAYYTELSERYPNNYYAGLAEDRLSNSAVFKAVASPAVMEFLNDVVWPLRRYPDKFDPTPATEARLERARLLDTAGLDDLAERELRFAARTDAQAQVVAIYLAQIASQYEAPHSAMRLLKNMVPSYLSIPLDDAPASFWRLLFPLPWRSLVERYARLQNLDPFLMAGLIRQESEFNPGAVSPARAYGLTQLLPVTGRTLLKASRSRFRASVLFQPEVNLRLGTTYLRQVFDQSSGKWELALAAYNAGRSRVQDWVTWAEYREPAEFIETIPFTETRNYVFAVLRNSEMYRKLYGPDGPLASERLEAVVSKTTAAPAKKNAAFKRTPVIPKKHRARRPSGKSSKRK